MKVVSSTIAITSVALMTLACAPSDGAQDYARQPRRDPAGELAGQWVCRDRFGRGGSWPTLLVLRQDQRMAFGLLQADGSVVRGGLLVRGSWHLQGSRIELYSSSGAIVQEAWAQFESDGSLSRLTFNGDPCELDPTSRYRSIY